MTKEEAIKRLKEGAPFSELYDKEWEEALNIALKALDQCEVWDGIHCQIVAPKGTFDKIYNEAEESEDAASI